MSWWATRPKNTTNFLGKRIEVHPTSSREEVQNWAQMARLTAATQQHVWNILITKSVARRSVRPNNESKSLKWRESNLDRIPVKVKSNIRFAHLIPARARTPLHSGLAGALRQSQIPRFILHGQLWGVDESLAAEAVLVDVCGLGWNWLDWPLG